jgi:plastocyanin
MELRSFSRYRHLLWITALVLLASGTLLLAACGGGSTSPSTPTPTTSSAGNNVSIVENAGVYSFNPATLTIPKGTTVTWTNKSDGSHTVTSDTNAFTASGTLKESQTFQTVFATAGTYTYHCAIHSYMKATIIVTS